MRNAPLRRGALVVLALVAIVACSDASIVGPSRAEAPDIGAPSLSRHTNAYIGTAKLLQREKPLADTQVDSVLVLPWRKASLQIRDAGLRIDIPKGAVAAPVWVKAVAYRGPKVYYEFYPSPFAFLKPVTVTQDLRNTKAYRDKETATDLRGAYLPGGVTDIQGDGTASVGEVFNTYIVPEKNKNLSRLAMYETDHFSGYILAVGFKESQPFTLR